MKVEVKAKVLYTCELSEADAEIVREYAEELQCDLELAVWHCYVFGKINLYNNSVESDFSTEEVVSVED